MDRQTDISHKGKIVEITPELTTVEIISADACSSCHAASLCGLSGFKKKLVQLPSDGWSDRKVGDEVDVVLKATMGLKAVWLAYVLPLIVLVAVLLIALESGAGEPLAALCAAVALALYFLCLYLLRNRLRNTYVFKISNKHSR